jgi:hypothetical protein
MVATESQQTHYEVNTQEAQTRDLVSAEVNVMHTTVVSEHVQTRTWVSQEASSTRTEVNTQNNQTRAFVASESEETHTTLTNVIDADGASSRVNTSAYVPCHLAFLFLFLNYQSFLSNFFIYLFFIFCFFSETVLIRQTVNNAATAVENTVTTEVRNPRYTCFFFFFFGISINRRTTSK